MGIGVRGYGNLSLRPRRHHHLQSHSFPSKEKMYMPSICAHLNLLQNKTSKFWQILHTPNWAIDVVKKLHLIPIVCIQPNPPHVSIQTARRLIANDWSPTERLLQPNTIRFDKVDRE